MIKEYLKKQNISIYELSKKSGVPYSTVNDLCNGKVLIENCKFGMVKKLADALFLSLEEFYDISKRDEPMIVHVSKYDKDVEIKIKNKRYVACFEYNGEPVELDVCKVQETNTFYVEDMTEWKLEDFIAEKHMEEFSDGILYQEKR